jgi:hypothetical protein
MSACQIYTLLNKVQHIDANVLQTIASCSVSIPPLTSTRY